MKRAPFLSFYLRPWAFLFLVFQCLGLLGGALRAQPMAATTQSSASVGSFDPSRVYLNYDGRYAYAPLGVPLAVHRVVDAANQLQRKPYVWGGGHRYYWDRGYDCSGSISHVLASAGLLNQPITASQFKRYGDPGPGKYITLFMNNGHVFMSVCGLRFDTSRIHDDRGEGPRWRPESRSSRGFAIRHPRGF
jgi:hypothetical protein